MSGGNENGQQKSGSAPGNEPKNLSDLSIADRWAPLVHDPERPFQPAAKYGQRVAAAALCLVVLALLLWAIA